MQRTEPVKDRLAVLRAGVGLHRLAANLVGGRGPSSELAVQELKRLAAWEDRHLIMTIELSDDWHLDEPLAYLVKNHSDYGREYEIFQDESDAKLHAEKQEYEAENDREPDDFQIYPLYAGNPT